MSRRAVSRKRQDRPEETPRPKPAPGPDACIVCGLLAILVLFIYAQTGSHGFINYDDEPYVVDNSHVNTGLTGSNLAWAFGTSAYYYWQPVTWISHMLDVELFGVAAGPEHLVSMVIHGVASCLLFFVLRRITGAPWQSAAAAILFAVHPLRVESVAWIAERKDVLSGLLWIVTIWAYAHYAEKRTPGRYGLLCAAFSFALMSKPTVVSLPLVLLLLDWWPLRRSEPWGTLIKEKLPLAGLSAICAAITFLGQRQMGAMDMLGPLPAGLRIENALVSLASYFGKTFWPHPLAILYPYRMTIPFALVAGSAVLVLIVTLLVLWRARAFPYLLTGWFWFLISVVPMIGLVQVGVQARADRFMYIPQIGLLIAIVWLAAAVLPVRVAAAGGAIAAIAFVGVSFVQAATWQNSATVFGHALEATSDNWLASFKYGMALAQQGRVAEAISQLKDSERINPGSPHAPYQLGKLLHDQGKNAEAMTEFRNATVNKPDYAEAWYSLGVLEMDAGQGAEAVKDFEAALRSSLEAHFASDAHNRMGVLYAQSGKLAEATAQFREAVRLEPGSAAARQNLQHALGAPHGS